MTGVSFNSGELPALPENVLIYFVTQSHITEIKVDIYKVISCRNTLPLYTSWFCKPLLSGDRLQYILRGIKRTQSQTIRPRLPITIQLLQQLCSVFQSGLFSRHMGKTLECMCIIAFYSFLRCSEFTVSSRQHNVLRIKDIIFSNDKTMFKLYLASSKTDPFRTGVSISFFQNKFLCPVTCMLYYLVNIREGASFSEAPLFVDEQNRPCTRELFISYLRLVLSRLGYPPDKYCAHSFRAGAASTADHMIKTLGRWNSSCYLRYIHVDQNLIKQAQQRLSKV